MANASLNQAKKNSLNSAFEKGQKIRSDLNNTLYSGSLNNGGLVGGIGYVGEKIGLGALSWAEGLVDFTVGGVASLTGNKEYAEQLMKNDWVNYSDADEWYNPGKGWRVAGDVAQGVGNSLPSIGITAVTALATGGLSLAGQAALTFGTTAVSAAGQGTKEAYQKTGKLTGKEWGYGALSGVIEGATEAAGDVFAIGAGAARTAAARAGGEIGKQATEKIAKESAEKIAESIGRDSIGKVLAKSFLGEATEEAVSEILTPIAARMTYDPTAEINPFTEERLKEIGYAALVGGLSGMVMGGTTKVITNGATVAKGNQIINNQSRFDDLMQTGKRIAETTNSNADLPAWKVTRDVYTELQASLAETNGKVETAKQRRLVAQLNNATAYASLSPTVYKAAMDIVMNPQEYLNAFNGMYVNSETGNQVTVTAEELTQGIDDSSGKALLESLQTALETNTRLREIVVMEAAGRLMINSEEYSNRVQNYRGDSILSDRQIDEFRNSTNEQAKADMGAFLGVDVNTATNEEIREAYNAKWEEKYGIRENDLRNGGERLDGTNSGEQIPGMESGTGENQSRAIQGDLAGQGIQSETRGDAFRVRNITGYRYNGEITDDMRRAESIAKESGANIAFFDGLMKDGKGSYRGFFDSTTNTLYISANNKNYTAEQIARHEATHKKIANGEIDVDEVKKRISENYDVDEIAEKYAEAYKGSGMTVEEAFEEIICDAEAGMNVFEEARKSVEEVRQYGEVLAETKQAAEESNPRAPPAEKKNASKLTESEARELLNNAFAKKYDKKSYIPVRANTPDILIDSAKSIGKTIDDLPIIMNVEKVRQMMSSPYEWALEGGRGTAHELSTDDIISIVKAMDKPKKIIYQTNDERYVEIVEFETSEKKKAIAVLEIGNSKSSKYINGYGSGIYQVFVTAFEPDEEYVDFLENKKENILIYPKKKKGGLQSASGNKVPSDLNKSPFYTIVSEKQKIVNRENQETVKASREITPEEDAEYLELAKDPEKNYDKLAKMVEKAARKAGYDYHGYHFTNNTGENYERFTVFDPRKQGRRDTATFFHSDIDAAGSYGIYEYDEYLRIDNPLIIEAGGDYWGAVKDHSNTETLLWKDLSKEQLNYLAKRYDMSINDVRELWEPDHVVDLVRTGLIERAERDTNEWAAYAKKNGYDGVIFKNIRDNAESFDDTLGTVYAVLSSKQIKSADPVTYDDNGNIIPLSERFNENNNDIRYSREIENNSEKITVSAVQQLREIANAHNGERVSVNDLTSEEIRKLEPWARKFWRELKEKSTFFRKWFGDWRAYDKNTKIERVELSDSPIEAKDISRAGAINKDTGWEIKVNSKGIDETASKNSKWSLAYHSLANINSMLERAVLLDTIVVNNPSSKMDQTATFIHSMYCPVSLGLEKGIAKLYVTENVGDEHKFYLTKIKMESYDSINQNKNSGRNSSSDSDISISEIYNFVNRFDAEFEKDSDNPSKFNPKPVNPLMLDEDGTPKILYHQTSFDFFSFSTDSPVAGKSDSETPNGIFLKENDHDIGIGGSKQMALFARMENPLHFANREEARSWYIKHIPEYAALQKEFDEKISDFNKKSDELERKWFDANRADDEIALEEIEKQEDALVKDFEPVETEYRQKLRKILDSYFIGGESGYDGIILDYDGHRYVNGKRENVHTYIVFKNTQVKSATDNIGTFDGSNPDIRFSQEIDTSEIENADEDGYKRTNKQIGYTQEQARETVDNIMRGLDEYAEMFNVKLDGIGKTTRYLYSYLNSVPDGYRFNSALKMADYILDNSLLYDAYENEASENNRQILNAISQYKGKLNLSAIRSEIQQKYGKKNAIFAQWGTSKGGVTVDSIVNELNESLPGGVTANNEADMFFEIVDKYTKARKELIEASKKGKLASTLTEEQRNEFRQTIAKYILTAFDQSEPAFQKTFEKLQNESLDLKKQLNFVKKQNDTIAIIDKINEQKSNLFENASETPKFKFYGILGRFGRILRGGNISANTAKSVMQDLRTWYNESPAFMDADGKKNAYYNGDIAAMIDSIADADIKDNILTDAQMNNLNTVMRYFSNFIRNYGKVNINGQLVEAMPLVKKYVTMAQNVKMRGVNKVLFNQYLRKFADPQFVLAAADGFMGGFHTDMLNLYRDAYMDYSETKNALQSPVKQFLTENSKYAESLTENVTMNGQTVPKWLAIACYMTSFREQAQAGLLTSQIVYANDKNQIVKLPVLADVDSFAKDGGKLVADFQSGIEKTLTATDKQFIALIQKGYEETRGVKEKTDKSIHGFIQTVKKGLYYPIRRYMIAKGIDGTGYLDEVRAAENISANKQTVQGARSQLLIENPIDVFERHTDAIAKYSAFSEVSHTYDILYNTDVSGDKNNPVSVKSETRNLWATPNGKGHEGQNYLADLILDAEGKSNKTSSSPIVGKIRSGAAVAAITGNPKVLATQWSSLLASTSVLKGRNLVKGLFMKAVKGDIDQYSRVAKDRNLDDTALRAMANVDTTTVEKARGALGKFTDFLLGLIGKSDRAVVTRLWGACQQQVAEEQGLAIGTPENKKKAGELLDRVIYETQQNASPLEKSAAMRSGSEIDKTLTMFRSDAMKVVSRVFESFGEMRATRSEESKAKFARSIGALVTVSAFMAEIASLFRRLYRKEEEDEVKEIATDFFGNLIGGLPVITDAYEFATKGYEVEDFTFSAVNDLMNGFLNLTKVFGNVLDGTADAGDIGSVAKQVLTSGGAMLGVPVRNLYNFAYGITKRVSPSTAYAVDTVTRSNISYLADLQKAERDGDEKLADTIMGYMIESRTGKTEAGDVIGSLYSKGYSVLPKSVGKQITYTVTDANGDETEETVKLKGSQLKQFKATYGKATAKVEAAVKTKAFASLSEKAQAKAIKKIYDTYYNAAFAEVTGIRKDTVFATAAKAMDVSKLSVLVAGMSVIESDKDRSGNAVSGSKKKKTVQYLSRQGLSMQERIFLLAYNGYTITDGDIVGVTKQSAKRMLAQYINRINATAEEKAELAKKCGLEVSGNRILASNFR